MRQQGWLLLMLAMGCRAMAGWRRKRRPTGPASSAHPCIWLSRAIAVHGLCRRSCDGGPIVPQGSLDTYLSPDIRMTPWTSLSCVQARPKGGRQPRRGVSTPPRERRRAGVTGRAAVKRGHARRRDPGTDCAAACPRPAEDGRAVGRYVSSGAQPPGSLQPGTAGQKGTPALTTSLPP